MAVKFRFVATLITIMASCDKVGNTMVFTSFPFYLRFRDKRVGKYEVHLRSGQYDAWAKVYEQYKTALMNLPLFGTDACEGVEWIGSTAIPGMAAKPVMDIMVTTTVDPKVFVDQLALEVTDPTWIADKSNGLEFPIGFW
jgi:hypothetical protein